MEVWLAPPLPARRQIDAVAGYHAVWARTHGGGRAGDAAVGAFCGGGDRSRNERLTYVISEHIKFPPTIV